MRHNYRLRLRISCRREPWLRRLPCYVAQLLYAKSFCLNIKDKPAKWKCGISRCRLELPSGSGASATAGLGAVAGAASPTAAAAAGSGGGSAGPSTSTTVPKATARASISIRPTTSTDGGPVTAAGTTASPFKQREWLDEQCGKISRGTREHDDVERVCRC